MQKIVRRSRSNLCLRVLIALIADWLLIEFAHLAKFFTYFRSYQICRGRSIGRFYVQPFCLCLRRRLLIGVVAVDTMRRAQRRQSGGGACRSPRRLFAMISFLVLISAAAARLRDVDLACSDLPHSDHLTSEELERACAHRKMWLEDREKLEATSASRQLTG